MLSSGFLMSVAQGFMEGKVEQAKQQREIDAAEAERRAESDKDFAKAVVDTINSDDFSINKLNLLYKVSGRGDQFNPDDYAEFANLANDIENTIAVGTFSFQKPEKWDEDLRPDNMLRAGGTWLRTFNTIAGDDMQWGKLSEALSKDPAAMRQFTNDFARYNDYYIMGMQKENRNPVSGAVSGYLNPSDAYGTLYTKMNELNAPVADNSDEVTKQLDEDITNPGSSVVFKFKDKDGVEQREARQFDEGTYSSLDSIALNLGYVGNENVSAVQQLVNSFADVSRANTADEAYQVLMAAAKLEKAGAFGFNRTAGMNNQSAAYVGNILTDSFGDDRILMVQAMAPLMKLEEDEFNKSSRMTYSMQPAATYFKKYLDVDVAQVKEQYGETQETLRLLNELKTKVAKETTPTGFVATLKTVFGGAFGEGGQLDQLLGNNTDGVGSQDVLQRAKDMGFISTTVIKDLSEIEAMKLTLAAKMARAVDPSGRLSNQDFEVQLQRLGQSGLFTGKVQAISKLDIVIEDFAQRSNRMTVLNELANAPQFGPREARILKANMAVQRSLDARRTGIYTGQTQQQNVPAGGSGGDSKSTTKKLTLDSDLGFYSDGTNFYYDEQGTKLVPADEVTKKMNEIYA
jgi:hypothetical protein